MESTKVETPCLETILFKFQPVPWKLNIILPSRELTYPTLGKGTVFKSALGRDMLVTSRVKLLVCRMDLLSNVAIFRINLN